MESYGPSYYTTLNLFTIWGGNAALRKSGLGMNITVQGRQLPCNIYMERRYRQDFSGWSSSNIQAIYMDPEKTYNGAER